jgi:hypothetical protein
MLASATMVLLAAGAIGKAAAMPMAANLPGEAQSQRMVQPVKCITTSPAGCWQQKPTLGVQQTGKWGTAGKPQLGYQQPAKWGYVGHSHAPARSDLRLKRDIVPLARLDNGIGLYRFRYRGGDPTTYVGVMAQEVAEVMPGAVSRGRDGYLRVDYGQLGLEFITWDEWTARHQRRLRPVFDGSMGATSAPSE